MVTGMNDIRVVELTKRKFLVLAMATAQLTSGKDLMSGRKCFGSYHTMLQQSVDAVLVAVTKGSVKQVDRALIPVVNACDEVLSTVTIFAFVRVIVHSIASTWDASCSTLGSYVLEQLGSAPNKEIQKNIIKQLIHTLKMSVMDSSTLSSKVSATVRTTT